MKKVLIILLAISAFLTTALLIALAFIGIYMNGFAFLDSSYERSHDVFGTYITDEGTAKIQIKDCGDGTPCGRFTWFSPKGLPAGTSMDAFKGADGKPLLGSLILKNFSKESSDWRGGKVYDSDNVKTYFAHLRRMPDGSLRVRGCLGPFCHTQIWPESNT